MSLMCPLEKTHRSIFAIGYLYHTKQLTSSSSVWSNHKNICWDLWRLYRISCCKGLVRSRHNKHLAEVGKTSFLGLKCLFWSPQTRLETSQGLVNKAWYRRPRTRREMSWPSRQKYPKHSWNLSHGLLTIADMWSRAAVTGLAAFSSVTPPPSPPSPHTKARS